MSERVSLMSVTTNNIAAVLREYGVTPFVARRAAQQLEDQWYLPGQVRTALRTQGLGAEFIAEAIKDATR